VHPSPGGSSITGLGLPMDGALADRNAELAAASREEAAAAAAAAAATREELRLRGDLDEDDGATGASDVLARVTREHSRGCNLANQQGSRGATPTSAKR